jgi:hypothetical protein
VTTDRVLGTVSWVRTENCDTVYISAGLAPYHYDKPYVEKSYLYLFIVVHLDETCRCIFIIFKPEENA